MRDICGHTGRTCITCPEDRCALDRPHSEVFLCGTCKLSHPTEQERRTCTGPAPAAPVERCHHGYRGEDGPPAEWLMVWFSGHLAGYATGYEHGHADGEQEYGASLQEALAPMRRAAAHGIDVNLARAAWSAQLGRETGTPPPTREGGGS